MRQLAKKTSEGGYEPSQEQPAKPTELQGVGTGQPTPRWKVTVPSAVQTTEEPQLMDFGAPVVEEAEGEDLPLLYGLDGMEKRNVVLEMRLEGPTLKFLGPTGYTINWNREQHTSRYQRHHLDILRSH